MYADTAWKENQNSQTDVIRKDDKNMRNLQKIFNHSKNLSSAEAKDYDVYMTKEEAEDAGIEDIFDFVKWLGKEPLMEFCYSDDMPADVLELNVYDLLCKHVTAQSLDDSIRGYKLYSLSKELGYEHVVWGSKSGNTGIMYHKDRITTMEQVKLDNSVRIVGHFHNDKVYYWADNLHSLIRYIRERDVCQLKSIPFYLVIIRNERIPSIYSYNGSVRNSVSEIKGAIQSSYKRISRVSDDIYQLGYTVKDFLKDNPILLE